MRSLVDGEQEWPGHFLGRHFKNPKQLESISKVDTSSQIKKIDAKFFLSPNFKECKKVNIGSGSRDWPGWICLDEINAKGVTQISFNENCDFPIEEKSVSLFYSSHFFEHF